MLSLVISPYNRQIKVNTAIETRITKRPLFYWVLKKHRAIQLVLFVIIVGSLFFRVFPLEMQKRIINKAIHYRKEELLFLYCALYTGAILLAGLSKYLINVIQTIIGQRIMVEIRTELYQHILRLTPYYLPVVTYYDSQGIWILRKPNLQSAAESDSLKTSACR